ncbi:hypothetical protein [Aestuariivirga sp.]|uniref:hypothetical protein n=1 Tax=Aestuariivirga sp. TaxID=2650926 RepID=UPI00391949C1
MLSRGCVFFNFGSGYALRLLVALHSFRQHYSGPISVLVADDAYGAPLAVEIERLGASAIPIDSLSKSFDRHRLFLESPYETTLAFDSDLVFFGGIDPLWPELEKEGVLVTRFYPAPYGLEGSPERPSGRMLMMAAIRHLVDPDTYAGAVRRICVDQKDVNIGVLGISRPKGNAFLHDLAEHIERGRNSSIMLLDEMLVVALLGNHAHHLAEEIWNCPADEFYRRTNLRDAVIIHYFAEGAVYRGIPIGRNPNSWAGKKWFDAFERAARDLDLKKWISEDPALMHAPA